MCSNWTSPRLEDVLYCFNNLLQLVIMVELSDLEPDLYFAAPQQVQCTHRAGHPAGSGTFAWYVGKHNGTAVAPCDDATGHGVAGVVSVLARVCCVSAALS